MAIELLEALATDFLEDEHFVSLGLIIENRSLHDSALHIRITELDLPFGVNQQNLVELDGLIFRRGKATVSSFAAERRLQKISFPASTLNCWPAMSTIAYI